MILSSGQVKHVPSLETSSSRKSLNTTVFSSVSTIMRPRTDMRLRISTSSEGKSGSTSSSKSSKSSSENSELLAELGCLINLSLSEMNLEILLILLRMLAVDSWRRVAVVNVLNDLMLKSNFFMRLFFLCCILGFSPIVFAMMMLFRMFFMKITRWIFCLIIGATFSKKASNSSYSSLVYWVLLRNSRISLEMSSGRPTDIIT
mmetsp:Transcript_38946/g.59202  ORF Transcript_38946/g.59202 Transcript_38946/m.59202 type:complete len:203 (-) Transcript_38946:1341-1949(-)